MPGQTRIRFDMAGVIKLAAGLRTGSGDIGPAMKKVGAYLLGYWRREYKANSRGGRRWAALDPRTIKRRTKGRKKGLSVGRSAGILIDHGDLVRALGAGDMPGEGGQLRVMGRVVRVGFDESQHPGKITYATLADIHHRGLGNVPARPIFVEPDQATANRMRAAIRRGIERTGDMRHGSR